MDPLTAALNLVAAYVRLMDLRLESLPPAERAAEAKAQLDRLQRWFDFLDRIAAIFHPQK